MKTIRIKIYKFDELSQDAKNKAIQDFREDGVSVDFIYSDAEKTVEAFNSLFGTSSGRDSWLDVNANNFDDDVLNLKGFRLQKYIWNNYYNVLFKGKFYNAIADNKILIHPCIEVHKYDVSKGARCSSSNFYYSQIQKTNSCVLTGVCYDNDLLQPIYEFLQKRDFSNCSTTFYDLLNECFYSLKKSIKNEIDYRNTDAAIIEDLEANDYDFLKDGTQY